MIIGIDLGSNTIRAALMNDNFDIVKSYEVIVGSARNLNNGENLSNEAKNNIINALKNIKEKFEFDKFKHIAVATEAFRMAKDGNIFFKFIKEKFDINFKIISGEDESKFVNLAVKNRLKKLNIKFNKILTIDLGGASTEISKCFEFKSFKFGIVTFVNKFDSIEKMRKNVNLLVENAKKFIKENENSTIVLTSGVPTTLIALKLGLNYEKYSANLVNGKILRYEEFDKYIDKILNMSESEASIKVGKNRAKYVIAGIILLKELLKSNFKDYFIVVDDGLREGVMISTMQKIIK